MVADHIQRAHDALVTFEIEQKFTVIGDDVFKLFDIRWRCRLQFLCAFGELQPLLETPQIVVDLLPVALRTQRTRQTGAVAVDMETFYELVLSKVQRGMFKIAKNWMKIDKCLLDSR